MIEWDYRVFREEDGDHIIRETFYDEQGQIMSCTRDGVEPVGSSLEELAEQIEAFRQALSLPVLTLEDVPKDDIERVREPQQNNISHEQVMAELGLFPEPHTPAGFTDEQRFRTLAAAGDTEQGLKILDELDANDSEAAWKANGWKQHDIFDKYPDGLDMFDEIEEERDQHRIGDE